MSKKAAEHHRKAAEHHEHAARHHKEAAKHHDAGAHEKAAHHAHIIPPENGPVAALRLVQCGFLVNLEAPPGFEPGLTS